MFGQDYAIIDYEKDPSDEKENILYVYVQDGVMFF
jgi:hypothetical protein